MSRGEEVFAARFATAFCGGAGDTSHGSFQALATSQGSGGVRPASRSSQVVPGS
jgi:hypothetical protein